MQDGRNEKGSPCGSPLFESEDQQPGWAARFELLVEAAADCAGHAESTGAEQDE